MSTSSKSASSKPARPHHVSAHANSRMAFVGSDNSPQRRQKEVARKKASEPKPNPPRKREPARAGAGVRQWRRRVTAIGELTKAMARVGFPLELWVAGTDRLFKLTIA
jgi:hypothetical protein